MTATGPALIALDFDGVIADALEECALVTWFGVRDFDRTLGGARQLRGVPQEFIERFAGVRDYSRLLDHFVVAHLPSAGAVSSQRDFDRLFAELSSEFVRAFTEKATATREWLRTREPDFWLDLHTLHPGIGELLRRFDGAAVVVTAKDAESVRAILARHGLDGTVAEIIGECGHKAEAVREVAGRWEILPRDIVFIDDNLTNALRVAETGADSRWAQWGYQTPEHRAEAARRSPAPLRLDELASLAPRVPPVRRPARAG
ncbi:HAD family hydrolase [Streptomyces sp. CAU 1734]|uniref:HAD family hydrolase n=1 Tax=Streptomyces sp. CAU 1734 TaxID=3140360 RepID=UPI003261D464